MMTRAIKRVAVTGGAGHIAYSLLFRIASGQLFGEDQPLALQVVEIPDAMSALEGVRMELEDCAFPLLKEIQIGSDPYELFRDADVVLLVGAKPRGKGMERKDLLLENGKIFIEQGKALNASASRDVLVLVIGNPCNTNCLIAMTNAPDLPRKNFHAMMRLDQNRAQSLLAKKAGVEVQQVTCTTIWGNHSTTQVPDFYSARIQGQSVLEQIHDHKWLEETFIATVQKRGSQIIEARGQSSAASAANAVIDAVQSLLHKTAEGQWFSSAVCTDDNPYGIEQDLIFSFPCRSFGKGQYEVVADLSWNAFLEQRIKASEKELLEEKQIAFSASTRRVK